MHLSVLFQEKKKRRTKERFHSLDQVPMISVCLSLLLLCKLSEKKIIISLLSLGISALQRFWEQMNDFRKEKIKTD